MVMPDVELVQERIHRVIVGHAAVVHQHAPAGFEHARHFVDGAVDVHVVVRGPAAGDQVKACVSKGQAFSVGQNPRSSRNPLSLL